jgi:succinate-semialdehyde dehydrogenase / glutarate-semialdehyde dehydrogenase
LVESEAVADRRIVRTIVTAAGGGGFVVLPSADLDRAETAAVASRCHNNGQSPVAAQRFVVHRDVSARFAELFVPCTSTEWPTRARNRHSVE